MPFEAATGISPNRQTSQVLSKSGVFTGYIGSGRVQLPTFLRRGFHGSPDHLPPAPFIASFARQEPIATPRHASECNQPRSRQFGFRGPREGLNSRLRSVLSVLNFQGRKNLLSTASKEADGCILPDAGWPNWKYQIIALRPRMLGPLENQNPKESVRPCSETDDSHSSRPLWLC